MTDSGQWNGTIGVKAPAPTPTPASINGSTQHAAPAVVAPRPVAAAIAAKVVSENFMPLL
ncbi:hypothetical protein GCM10022280_22020 [Sphingomonas swuensis]|uniref:Uncharacterized protein n=1 Tax=Sphingomonas swuensis TaxID=977800 RepID=A0ABP7T4S0_9SPHN